MTTSLVPRRDYLNGQRKAIVARAIVGSVAGLLPIPFVDDWAIGTVLGGGYRQIAAAHGVDLDDEAIAYLVHGTSRPPSVVDMAAGGIAFRIAGKAARRMLLALATVNRARSAARTFVTMTLFDHYCARLHVGMAIDGATALALREEIGRAINSTPGALAFHPFRRGALSAARATLRAPLELADMIAGGRLRKLLTRKAETDIAEVEVVDELEQTIDAAVTEKTGFLARTVAAVEVQLSAEANPFLDHALEALDRNWRARMAALAKGPTGAVKDPPKDPTK